MVALSPANSKGGQWSRGAFMSIIGNFMGYQDRLQTNLLQLFTHPENLECFFLSLFLRSTLLLHRIKHNW